MKQNDTQSQPRIELEALELTKGRKHKINSSELLYNIPAEIIDEQEILRSKGIRRLSEKTQVHSLALNPHISNRMTHTFEVAAASTEIASSLGLNVGFCRTGALGHDIGHPPFGHLGEKVLDIKHPQNGAIILQEVEKRGAGLNLNWETVEAILLHSTGDKELHLDKNYSNEINVLILADKIAYTFSDIRDFERVGMLEGKNLPEEISKLGDGLNAKRESVSSCINAIVKESIEKGKVSFSESEEAKAFKKIRNWMYKEMYNPLDYSDERKKMTEMLKSVLDYLPTTDLCGNLDPAFVVSMMTDKEVNILADLLDKKIPTEEEINKMGFSIKEIIPSLEGKEIDYNKNPLW